jgi:eukaryotic-like serine/threonine-protein kinase
MIDLIGTHLGQYELVEVIGRGGMATVYKAYQPSLDRFVAVKVMVHTQDPQFAARFKREARAIAHLQHHNILPIYDYGEQGNLLYLVLQYVENSVTLQAMMDRPMAPVAALSVICHVLNALDYAHAHGVIHRDIKPANILMPSPEWPMLADFGIAKLMNENQRLTMSGLIIGTAAYMTPEQATGHPVDARTDVYLTGVVLYEVLTGRVPFESDTPLAVLVKHVYEPPPSPRSLNRELPEEIEAPLLRALAKNPNERYQSAAEMAEALARVSSELKQSQNRKLLASLYQEGAQAIKVPANPAVDQTANLHPVVPPFLPKPEQRATAEGYTTNRIVVAEQALEQHPRRSRVVWGLPAILLAVVAGGGAATWFAQSSPTTPTLGGVANTSPIAAIVEATVPNRSQAPSFVAPTLKPTTPPTATLTPPPTATLTPPPTLTPTTPPTLAPTTPPTPAPAAVVNVDQLKLRSGPGQEYPIVGQYPHGTPLHVLGKIASGQWIQVRTPDERVGWIFAQFLQVNVDLATVPLAEVPPTPTKPPTPKPRPTIPPPMDTPVPAAPTAAPVEPPTPTAVPAEVPTPTVAPVEPPTPAPTRKPDRPKPTSTPRP